MKDKLLQIYEREPFFCIFIIFMNKDNFTIIYFSSSDALKSGIRYNFRIYEISTQNFSNLLAKKIGYSEELGKSGIFHVSVGRVGSEQPEDCFNFFNFQCSIDSGVWVIELK